MRKILKKKLVEFHGIVLVTCTDRKPVSADIFGGCLQCGATFPYRYVETGGSILDHKIDLATAMVKNGHYRPGSSHMCDARLQQVLEHPLAGMSNEQILEKAEGWLWPSAQTVQQ